jgi:hypothetical protein
LKRPAAEARAFINFFLSRPADNSLSPPCPTMLRQAGAATLASNGNRAPTGLGALSVAREAIATYAGLIENIAPRK